MNHLSQTSHPSHRLVKLITQITNNMSALGTLFTSLPADEYTSLVQTSPLIIDHSKNDHSRLQQAQQRENRRLGIHQ